MEVVVAGRWRGRAATKETAQQREGEQAPPGEQPEPGEQRPGARGQGPERESPEQSGRVRYLRLGRYAWASLGLAGLFALGLYIIGQLSLIVVPLVLALFPAALLWPLAEVLRRLRLPDALASIVSLLVLIATFAVLVALVVPAVIAELPDLIDSFSEGLEQIDGLLREGLFGFQVDGLGQLVEMAQEQAPAADELAATGLAALITAVEVVIGFVLILVGLFFYLKDGRRIVRGITDLLPAEARRHTLAVGSRTWDTIGGFLRGQLLVALVDAVFIGIGLALLGVPLAFPLAVIVFVGGLFPIVGAFLSGLIAVLVALADAGPLIALAAFGIVVAVQQIESNVLEPFVLGRVVRLHPLIVIAVITAGGILAGVLGAFLSVPVAASIARAVEYVRGEPAADDADDAGDAGGGGERTAGDRRAASRA